MYYKQMLNIRKHEKLNSKPYNIEADCASSA